MLATAVCLVFGIAIGEGNRLCEMSGGGCLPRGTICDHNYMEDYLCDNGMTCCYGRDLCSQLYGGTCQNAGLACDQYVENPQLCDNSPAETCCLTWYVTQPSVPPPVRPDGTYEDKPQTPVPTVATTPIPFPETTTPPEVEVPGQETPETPETKRPLGTNNLPGCGVSSNPAGQWRITYGMKSSKSAWPWQVSIQIGGEGGHFCGGSIINEYWILTAAHCMKFYLSDPSAVSVRAGELRIYETDDTEQERKVYQILMHQEYNYLDASPHDLALVKLAKPLIFNDHVKPICLPENDESFTDVADCWVTGWGQTYNPSADQTHLQQVNGPIISNAECSVEWNKVLGEGGIHDNMVCFGRGYIGSCKGDSGGPLTCRKGGTFYQVGVVSFGWVYCNQPGLPSVFTRVTKYIDWINFVLQYY